MKSAVTFPLIFEVLAKIDETIHHLRVSCSSTELILL